MELAARGLTKRYPGVVANHQVSSFDSYSVASGLDGGLAQGRFRFVLVLNDAPDELGRKVRVTSDLQSDFALDNPLSPVILEAPASPRWLGADLGARCNEHRRSNTRESARRVSGTA